jgi:hypothetical protein
MRQYNRQLTARELSAGVLGVMPGVGNADGAAVHRHVLGDRGDGNLKLAAGGHEPGEAQHGPVVLHELKRVTAAAGGRVLPLGFPSRRGSDLSLVNPAVFAAEDIPQLLKAERCEATARLVRAGVLKEAAAGVVAAAAPCGAGLSSLEQRDVLTMLQGDIQLLHTNNDNAAQTGYMLIFPFVSAVRMADTHGAWVSSDMTGWSGAAEAGQSDATSGITQYALAGGFKGGLFTVHGPYNIRRSDKNPAGKVPLALIFVWNDFTAGPVTASCFKRMVQLTRVATGVTPIPRIFLSDHCLVLRKASKSVWSGCQAIYEKMHSNKRLETHTRAQLCVRSSSG